MTCTSIPSTIQTPVTNLLVNTVVALHNGQAIIFDPAAPLETIVQATNGHQVAAVLLTHGHWDHVFSLLPVLAHFKCPCYMHPNALNKLNNPVSNGASTHNLAFALDPTQIPNIKFLHATNQHISANQKPTNTMHAKQTNALSQSQVATHTSAQSNTNQSLFAATQLKVGNFKLSFVATPGHSDCSVTYILGNNLICGDVLRKTKIARTDLPSANQSHLHASLAYFGSLDQGSMVFNGHDTPAPLSAFMLNPN